MLDLAVLGLLKEKPMYGYELKKRLDERLGHAWKFSYGSLYPTLKKLQVAGAVEEGLPEGEPTRSKRRKVYLITPVGEELFARLVDESDPQAAEDREAFMLRLAFFRYTKPETRRRLMERRRGYLLDRLTKITDSLKNMRERMDAYSLQLMQYGATETEHDIRWLDTMLEAERNGSVSTVPTRPVEERA